MVLAIGMRLNWVNHIGSTTGFTVIQGHANVSILFKKILPESQNFWGMEQHYQTTYFICDELCVYIFHSAYAMYKIYILQNQRHLDNKELNSLSIYVNMLV